MQVSYGFVYGLWFLKDFDIGQYIHYMQTFQPDSFKPVMLTGIIAIYHFTLLSVDWP